MTRLIATLKTTKKKSEGKKKERNMKNVFHQPDHSKGDQSWVFIGRTDAEAETPILWPPHAKS